MTAMPKRKCDKHSLARSRARASGWRTAENAFLRFFVNCSNPLDNVFELSVHRHIHLEPNPPGEAEGLRLLLLQKLRCVCWTMRSHVKKIKKEILLATPLPAQNIDPPARARGSTSSKLYSASLLPLDHSNDRALYSKHFFRGSCLLSLAALAAMDISFRNMVCFHIWYG